MAFWWPAKTAATGLRGGEENAEPPSEDKTTYSCNCGDCDFESENIQALTWHLYKQHRQKHFLRLLVRGSVCAACMREFHTRERLWTHFMQSSARCQLYYVTSIDPIPDHEHEQLEEESLRQVRMLHKSGRRRAYAPGPPFPVPGPLTSDAIGLGISHTHRLRK